jgi:Lrp/AsnC family transcriptional regulator for asnA, asnC and gidA
MIDAIDQQIINILRKDGRITNVDIAKKIKRSESTVRQRITKLQENGILRKFSVIVDANALGYKTTAYLGINTEPSKLLKVIKSLREIDPIQTVATTTGEYMIVCEIWAEDSSNLATIMEKIEKIDGILKVIPSIIQEKYYNNLKG